MRLWLRTASAAFAVGLATSAVVAIAATVPDAPTGLTATPGDSQVALAWSAPANTGGSPISHYTVTASPGTFHQDTADASTTTMTVTPLTNGTAYTFSVTATNTAGAGPAATASATPQAPPTPSPTPTPTPTPVPTPTPPQFATIGLDPAAGGPSVGITVTGQLFLPNESITLYWDDPSRVAGSTVCNASGAFTVVVKPFPGDAPGVHHLYASVQPKPHADFTLQGPPSPTPAASPTPSDSPSPSPSPIESPSPSPSPSPVPVANISGIDIITKPPFVFLPIIGALGLLGVIAYWALGDRRSRTSALPASVVHRSFRPDYGPPLGASSPPPPPAGAPPSELIPTVDPPSTVQPPASEPPTPAYWPPTPPTAPQPVEPPSSEWPAPPPAAPPDPPGAPDAPPDLPEPSE